jgi:AcrR family transcriptional regulator
MGGIAKAAGISVGNIYKYYSNKEELFYGLIEPEFVDSFRNLFSTKVSLGLGIEMSQVIDGPKTIEMDDDIQQFLYQHRLKLIILLGKSEGTRYENIKTDFINFMKKMVEKYISSMKKKKKIHISPVKTEMIAVIYENLFNAFIKMLQMFTTPEEIGDAYKALLEYHYMGLSRYLD